MTRPKALLVMDLETVPDTAILAPDRDPEKFPKPIQHQIASLGFMLTYIHRDGEYERHEVHRLGSVGLERQDEASILRGFWQMVDRFSPRVVTWNGRGFDIPVLKQRSLIHGVAAHQWHRVDPRFGYDYRFNSDWHCDLMDVLSDYGAAPRLGLEEAAIALGLPGKIESHGSEVAELLAAGDHGRINRYCEGDVLLTYLLYLRWGLLSTRLSARSFNASVRHLIGYLEQEGETRTHLLEFLERWTQSTRPFPLYVPEPDEHNATPQAPESHLRSEDVMP